MTDKGHRIEWYTGTVEFVEPKWRRVQKPDGLYLETDYVRMGPLSDYDFMICQAVLGSMGKRVK